MTACGYAPVSPDGQTLDAQVRTQGGRVERVFSEKKCGAKTDRAAGPTKDLKGRHLTPSPLALIAAEARHWGLVTNQIRGHRSGHSSLVVVGDR